MVVSFKGISNIDVNKSVDERNIPYWKEGVTEEIQMVPRTTTKVSLKCNLSDDKAGNDMGDFYNAMNTSKTLCQNPEGEDMVEIELNRHEAMYKGEKLDGKTISLNGVIFDLSKSIDMNALPLFTYMNNLSSKLMERDDVDSKSKEALKDISSVTGKVIDEMM